MRITVIGCGYVGLVNGCVLCRKWASTVTCVDPEQQRHRLP